jgi:hypothetical protein
MEAMRPDQLASFLTRLIVNLRNNLGKQKTSLPNPQGRPGKE